VIALSNHAVRTGAVQVTFAHCRDKPIEGTMVLKWLDAREATAMGAAFADDIVARTAPEALEQRTKGRANTAPRTDDLQILLQKFVYRVDREALPLHLNVFQRAKLANSFKWRLLERGVDNGLVEELTRALVVRLNGGAPEAKVAAKAAAAVAANGGSQVHTLLARGNELLAKGDSGAAAQCFEELLGEDPDHAVACNNLGAALCNLGRYAEAEAQFRRAIKLKERFADPHNNLGTVLRWQGRVRESEASLRRALKLKPAYVDAQINLSTTLVLLHRWREAKALLEKVLRVAPRNVAALVAMGQIAGPEGRFAEAADLFRRAAEIDPQSARACAAQVWLRKMTPADSDWLKHAEKIVAAGVAPQDEATLRYALGKYFDDVADYPKAFRSFQRANELQRVATQRYSKEGRTAFVDDMRRVYTRETLARAAQGGSDSQRPVFVVGMPRSGTSLIEQIIASHPSARGAGELGFWSDAMRKHEQNLRRAAVADPLRRKLADSYLQVLAAQAPDGTRVVDKATFNTDYLGVIHAVFPKARMIYVRRDPIDSCLSCYFQQFSPDLDFSMDLSDLAHYYPEHLRLLAHWRSVLPPGILLEVPYADLIAQQETWTRKIVEFLGLEWDQRCLDYTATQRTVLTSSYWQVRQKMYRTSLGRWHHYEKFITPLLGLRDSTA
jgi:tetratricopeptide (TPR) repeat protein